MRLRELLSGLDVPSVTGSLDAEIRGLAYDSRRVSPGDLFFAIRGERLDGTRFIPAAVAQGATAVVSAAPVSTSAVTVQVRDDRRAMAVIAGNFYGHPTRTLRLTGVTGTSGKTTTTYIIESILRAAGHPAGLLGTIEYRGPGFAFAAERTTGEAPDLEKLFRRIVDAGWRYAVMEASSHAIELKRVAGLYFDVAVFTNLSPEHLDFHGGMEAYFRAKRKLFEGMDGGRPRVMVLNADDPRYDDLRSIDPARVISFALSAPADVRPSDYTLSGEATDAVFETPAGRLHIRTSLIGKANMLNIGAAIGTAVALAIPAEAIIQGVQQLQSAPGRFERINNGQPFRVIVDYAHKIDALEKALQFAREITPGRLIVVFGCGGERDRTKRPLMGAAAARLADYTIVTSDNPRSEDPVTIIREIEQGMQNAEYRVEVDRREAIRTAFAAATDGDTVLIAGKGHETYQTIGTTAHPFDDRAVARELLDEFKARRY